MANTTIQLKKSSIPSSKPTDLANGELAINFADGKLYYKNVANYVVEYTSSQSNDFGTVSANGTLLVADTIGDVLTIAAGNNINITADAVNDRMTISLSNDVVIPAGGTLKVLAVGGDEGGEIKLANAVTNSVLNSDIIIDIYQNKLRFFESGGTNRGAFINLASAGAGVGTDLLAVGNSAVDSVARDAASSAFNKANNALANTDGITFGGNLNVSRNLVADKVLTSNNGQGENLRIGDDAWFGDTNLADTVRLKGQQNSSNGYIMFGQNDGILLGRQGSNALTYGGNTVWHAGNDGTGSGLDADFLDGQHGSYYGTATDVTSAFNAANAANVVVTANVNYVNTAVQSAFLIANTALSRANAANVVVTANVNYTNTAMQSAFLIANTALSRANAANVVVTANVNYVNTAMQSAFGRANDSFVYANSTFVKLSAGSQTIVGNLSITGSLVVSGNSYKLDANTLSIQDPLIYLAGNNYVSDTVDIGFIANYVNATGQNVHTGLFRDATSKEYYLFQGYDQEPINNHIDPTGNNISLSVLNADIRTSNLNLAGTNAIVWITSAFNRANSFNIDSSNTTAVLFNNLGQANTSNSFVYDFANNRVGIGTQTPQYNLEVVGSFAAQTKSFVINHQTKPNSKLTYGSLEGPENGVYVRGKSISNIIKLPDYWSWLIDEETITVNITPVGRKQDLFVKKIENNEVHIGGARKPNFYYTVFAERKDVPKLIVES